MQGWIDRIGDIPLMRVNAIHHTIALVRAPKAGVQHINHQLASSDDVMRSHYLLNEKRVPIVFGPGRHPTSGARFLYFKRPDGVVFEYSVGVDGIADEVSHRLRQFGFEAGELVHVGRKDCQQTLPKIERWTSDCAGEPRSFARHAQSREPEKFVRALRERARSSLRTRRDDVGGIIPPWRSTDRREMGDAGKAHSGCES